MNELLKGALIVAVGDCCVATLRGNRVTYLYQSGMNPRASWREEFALPKGVRGPDVVLLHPSATSVTILTRDGELHVYEKNHNKQWVAGGSVFATAEAGRE